MARLETRTDAEISPELLERLARYRINGNLPDVYRQMAVNESVLVAYLNMEETLASCSLAVREVEAIKLTVSELSRCEFCLAVHTMKAAKAGLDEAAQLNIRAGQPCGDARVDAVAAVARHCMLGGGTLATAQIEELRLLGFDDSAFMEIVLAASTIFLTNSFNHFNDTPLSVPPAKPLSV